MACFLHYGIVGSAWKKVCPLVVIDPNRVLIGTYIKKIEKDRYEISQILLIFLFYFLKF